MGYLREIDIRFFELLEPEGFGSRAASLAIMLPFSGGGTSSEICTVAEAAESTVVCVLSATIDSISTFGTDSFPQVILEPVDNVAGASSRRVVGPVGNHEGSFKRNESHSKK